MKTLLILFGFLLGLLVSMSCIEIFGIPELEKSMEYAYFEGQRDYCEGDIRIGIVDSYYVWIKTPWNNGQAPKFVPININIKNVK